MMAEHDPQTSSDPQGTSGPGESGQPNIDRLADLDGVDVERDDDGQIRLVRMPPEHEGDELHPDQVEGYEPKVDRASVARRVLMHVTDQEHAGRGPRNTVQRLVQELVEDPDTNVWPGDDEDDEHHPLTVVQTAVDRLLDEGLVAERDDGTLAVTDAGLVELRN